MKKKQQHVFARTIRKLKKLQSITGGQRFTDFSISRETASREFKIQKFSENTAKIQKYPKNTPISGKL